MNKYFFKYNGFSLVELIVVVSILIILWTIAFINMVWYWWKSRDTNRINDVKNLSDWLAVYYTKIWNYPNPEKYVTVKWSWNILRYQWLAWNNILGLVLSNINKWMWRDPKNWNYYTYVINWNKSQFQIISYFEKMESFWSQESQNLIERKYSWITLWYPKFTWNDLGIILENEIPIHNISSYVWNSFDLKFTTNTYKMEYNNIDTFYWSWLNLFTNICSRS